MLEYLNMLHSFACLSFLKVIRGCEILDIAQGNWQLSKTSLFDNLSLWETKVEKLANGF